MLLTAAGSATASPATPRKRKGAGDDNGTPVKKRASPKKKMASEEPSNDLGDSGLDLPVDMDQFSTSVSITSYISHLLIIAPSQKRSRIRDLRRLGDRRMDGVDT